MSTTGKKLARVEHIRCGEYTACTYVWVRDNMSDEEFQERVEAAEKEYLEALAGFSKLEKTQAVGPINWENQRERTVGEVLDEHAAARAAWTTYNKSRQTAMQDFAHFLHRQEGIDPFWQVEPDVNGQVDWGHQHGQAIAYGDTRWPEFRLLRGTKRGRPGGQVTLVEDDEEWT